MSSINIYLDNREGSLKELFNKADSYNIIYKNLEYGDIIIDVNDIHLMVIERKTLSDLAASLKDGRYKNQKNKLLNEMRSTGQQAGQSPNNSLYYIIEGAIDFTNNDVDIVLNGINKKTMLSCIINTLIRDDIKVLITKDINETFDLLKNIIQRVSSDPDKYIKNVITPSDQVIKIKTVKCTKDVYFERLLCQIPDISTKTAKAICLKFNNFKSLYDSLNSLDYDNKMKVLKEIYLEDGNGKKRKISEKIYKNLIEYLF